MKKDFVHEKDESPDDRTSREIGAFMEHFDEKLKSMTEGQAILHQKFDRSFAELNDKIDSHTRYHQRHEGRFIDIDRKFVKIENILDDHSEDLAHIKHALHKHSIV